MTTTLTSGGQIIIPDVIRELDQLRPGDGFEVRRMAPGRYELEKVLAPAPHATRRRGPYGHDVLVAPSGTSPLTHRFGKELLNEA